MKPFNLLVGAVIIAPGKVSGSIDLKLSKFISAGEMLVVEHVSTSSEMPTGQIPDPVIVVLDNQFSNVVVQHYLLTQFQLVYAGKDIHKSSTPLRMHLLQDLIFRVDFVRNTVNDEAFCFCGISGYITKA